MSIAAVVASDALAGKGEVKPDWATGGMKLCNCLQVARWISATAHNIRSEAVLSAWVNSILTPHTLNLLLGILLTALPADFLGSHCQVNYYANS